MIMTTSASDQSKSSPGGEDDESLMEGDDVAPPPKASGNPKKGPAAKKAAVSKSPAKQPAKRGRKKRPKDMPQRPLSAYNLFFRAEREEIIKNTSPETIISTAESIRGPEASCKSKKRINLFQALAVLISKKWKSLGPEERISYEKMAKEEMTAYRKKLGDYQIQLVRKSMSETNGDNMKDESGKGSTTESKLGSQARPDMLASKIPPGIVTATPKLLGGPAAGNFTATSKLLGGQSAFNTLGAGGTPSGSMFSPSIQAQLNASQLTGARMPQGDQSSQPQSSSMPSQLGASSNGNPGVSQLARQQQNPMMAMDPFLQGHFDSQQGFPSSGAGMPSYFQDLMFAQQQQQFGQFGMQQQGDFMQRMQALQQQVPQGSQGGFSATGLDPATASLYGLTQGFPSAGSTSGLTPDLQAFLQQQQQASAAPSSGNCWNQALLPTAGQRTGAPADWSYLLNAGGGDASSLTAMGGVPTASGTTMGAQNPGAGGGGGATDQNNSDQLSDVLRMLQHQQQSFRQAPNF